MEEILDVAITILEVEVEERRLIRRIFSGIIAISGETLQMNVMQRRNLKV